jgi:glutamate/aspartate transport system permease protein
MNYDWNWRVFLELAPDGVHTFLEMIIIGAAWTILLALGSWSIAFTFGTALAVMRTSTSRVLNRCGEVYVEIFRNIPLIVQMFLWYFVVPEMLPDALGQAVKQMRQPWGQFFPALLCLSLYGSARVAELVRTGIEALPQGQFQAGLALGLTEPQVYRYVILPEALRIMLPPLSSEFMAAIKYSSVALTIGLLELTGQARAMQEDTFHIFEPFTVATTVYIAINLIVVLATTLLDRRIGAINRDRRATLSIAIPD